MAFTVPFPRSPLDGTGDDAGGLVRWYEHELGWAAVAGPPVQLVTGLRFDVLELPATAGRGVLRRMGAATGPVALMGRRMRLLVAAGSAEELPGLLDWLEWGGISLDLAVLGADVVVAELEGLTERELQDLLGARGEGDVPGRGLLPLPDDLLHLLADRLERNPEALQGLSGDTLTLVDKAQKDVLGADVVVVEHPGFFLSQDDNPPRAVGEPLEHR